MKVLVAGVGNVLRGDDGFGVVAAQRLASRPSPAEVRVVEVGIGGIHLVQELMDATDALIVLDAVDRGRPPGTVVVIRPTVIDVDALPPDRRREELADMHWATPERAFMLARALGILPEKTWVVGCQAMSTDGLGQGLSPEVEGAVEPALGEVRRMVEELGVAWP